MIPIDPDHPSFSSRHIRNPLHRIYLTISFYPIKNVQGRRPHLALEIPSQMRPKVPSTDVVTRPPLEPQRPPNPLCRLLDGLLLP
jgi:hypothetical protein